MTPRFPSPALYAAMTAALIASSTAGAADWPAFSPPAAKKGDTVDTLHGVKVPDPYRWLESTETDEAKAWIETQATAARKLLGALPARETFRKRLEALWNYDKHGLPRALGGRLFYSKKTGLQNQSVHYWRPASGGEEKVLLDANTLSADGTVAVSDVSVSEDGKYFAYSTSASGSDWEEWRVIEVSTGKTLPEVLKWVKFSGASWSADGRGFYYNRYAAPKTGEEYKAENLHQKVWFHVVGTPQEQDTLVYERPDQPKWMFGVGESEDGRFRLMDVDQGAASKNAVFIAERKGDGTFGEFRPLMDAFDARYRFVGNEAGTLFFFTDKDAPRGRLIAVEAGMPAPADWKTLVPESKSALQSVSWLGGRFIAQYLTDAHDEVRLFDRAGKPAGEVALPDLGAVGGFGGRQADTETYYVVTGYTRPASIFHYDVATGKSTPWWQAKVDFDPAAFTTEQVFYTSKDGTRVPMFVVHRKDLPKGEPRPTVLYGYGGFNISLGPSFSPSLVAWLEKGGVYAVANLRGGGEYGEEWHSAGQRLKKQNVFDDFIAAAEHLVREGRTTPAQLGISGGSNGGLLVAACLLQRPDLFGAASPEVGVHDLLRFQKFTIGWAWQDEYGHPETDEADFKNLLKLSPVHNVKPANYPATMVQTADHDDRVFPAHSFKFGAALQAAQQGKAPIILRIETKAGHGAGTPTSKLIESAADEWAFFAKALGLKVE